MSCRSFSFVTLVGIIVIAAGVLAFLPTPADPISFYVGWVAMSGVGVGAWYLGNRFITRISLRDQEEGVDPDADQQPPW